MSDTVLLDVDGAVATVTLNRPAALNSLTGEAKDALGLVVTRLAADPAVRAVVLTGAGRAFCAGQDLREYAGQLQSGDPGTLRAVVEQYTPLVRALGTLPKPLVAAVNGTAAGAGASLTFAADFRIAAESATFLLAFANVGLTLDSGASWTLSRLVGHARATAMALLAEPVSATHALEMGLVNAVVPDDAVLPAARELATRLAAGPTAAYAATKQALAFAATATLEQALDREAELQHRLAGTADHRGAVAAFLRKERPTFTGH